MFTPTALNLPPYPAQIRHDADSLRGGHEIYDILRRRWVALTPEEWVRQNFVHFLIAQRGFQSSFMANEIGLRLNGTLRRCDTVVYTRSLKPLVIVEYKAPEIQINQKVFDQIARYNIVLGAEYLIVSNGLSHYCCRFGADGYKFLKDVPFYKDLL
ncbi:MAG: type I restriction enzyme HsdR N-terminal domain-containing protein [Muribaculaceae bacterium]|nr:type I restriction enzyme HsdR N-terminal domain-containing protein [Muribaculaceae bacterium]